MFSIILQLHGGGSGGGSNGETKWIPNEYQVKVLDQMTPKYGNYLNQSQSLLNNAQGMYSGLAVNPVDYGGILANTDQANATAMNGFGNLAQGNVAGYTQNETNALNTVLQNTMGNQLNNLANKGVLNSSVMNNALNDMTKQAASTAAQDYNTAISNSNNTFNNMVQTGAQNIANAQNAQNAAQLGASNLLTDSLSAFNAGSGILGTNSGTSTVTNSNNGNGWLTGIIGAGVGAMACFPEGTLILTPSGEKDIKNIKVGDKVTSYKDGVLVTETVEEIQEPVKQEIVEVVCEDEDGNRHFVETTATQPFLTEGNTYDLVKGLHIGQKLKCVGKIVAIMIVGEDYVYDLKVSGNNTYFANGFVAYGRME